MFNYVLIGDSAEIDLERKLAQEYNSFCNSWLCCFTCCCNKSKKIKLAEGEAPPPLPNKIECITVQNDLMKEMLEE